MSAQNGGNHSNPVQASGLTAQLFQSISGGNPMLQMIHDAQMAPEMISAAAGGDGQTATPQHGRVKRAAGRPRLEQSLLVLAGGGSGREEATRFKASLVERFGEKPENVVFLAFDSANDPVSVREGRHGRIITLEDKSEFIPLERVPLTGIKRAPHYHPAFVQRLGDNLGRIRRASIGDGCAQERPQGLATLVWNAPRVMRAIENAVRLLVERSDDLARAAGERRGLTVVLLGSTCGGQGSAIMQELAHFAHQALRQVGDLEESSRFIGVALLPGAFPGLRGANLLPNTQAFFREIDATMRGAAFSATYPGDIVVDNLERPLDVLFVVNGIDERGQAFASHDEVCEQTARSLAVLLSSEVGLREIFAAVNEHGVLNRVSTAGWGTYLATLGQASLRFPAGPVAERCALRLAAEVAAWSLTDLPPSEGTGVSLAGSATLRERLRLTANGAPFDTQIVAPVSLEQAPAEEQPTMARALLNNFLQHRLYTSAFGQMQTTSRLLGDSLRSELTAGLTAAQRAANLAAVSAWTHSAAELLQTQYAALLAEAERLATAVERSQAVLEAAGGSMDQAADSLILGRKSRVRAAVNRYLDEAGAHVRLRLEQRVTEAAAEVTHGVLSDARTTAQQAIAAAQRLAQARSLLQGRAAELERLAVGQSEINLATPELVAQLFAQYRSEPATLAQQALTVARPSVAAAEASGADLGLLAWASLTAETLAMRLLAVAQPAFQPIREITVEQALAGQWDERSAQQWIHRLATLSAGAWNLDQARLPDGGAHLASFLTIGVPDATASIFANCGETLVTTHDAERIVALRTVYGAAVDALKGADDWQRAYERAVAAGTPLHVTAVGDGVSR